MAVLHRRRPEAQGSAGGRCLLCQRQVHRSTSRQRASTRNSRQEQCGRLPAGARARTPPAGQAKDLRRKGPPQGSGPGRCRIYFCANVTLRYRCLDLIWRLAARIVRFVIVCHPHRGTIFLLSTDLTLDPLEILLLYGYRFRIELGFRQAVHVLGAYAYHFWMSGMKPLRRGDGNQYLHRTSDAYRAAPRRKMAAFHNHVQLGCIAQGLLQHLAINHTAEVWRSFRSWLRTMNPALPPSELVTANALRAALPAFFSSSEMDPNLRKIIDQYTRPDIHLDSEQKAA